VELGLGLGWVLGLAMGQVVQVPASGAGEDIPKWPVNHLLFTQVGNVVPGQNKWQLEQQVHDIWREPPVKCKSPFQSL